MVSGIVYANDTKEPLLGVNINAGAHGTITDIDGSFSLNVTDGSQDITISYVGFKEQTISIADFATSPTQIYLKISNTFLETAVVTGTRYEQNISDSPVSISILKPQLIENTNTQTIEDALDKMPGVQIIDGQVNIRGGSGYSYGAGSRVLLLVDDMPALQGDAGRPSWGDIPVENISQIEIVKGASSSLYGSAALNGIINIRTGYAVAEPETHISTSFIYFDDPKDENKKWWGTGDNISYPRAFSSNILHKRKIGKSDIVLNGNYYNEKSYLEDGYDKRYRLSANYRYRYSDRLTLNLNSMYNFGEAGDFFLWSNGGGGAYKALGGSFSTRAHDRFYIDPSITYYDKGNNRHKLLGRYYYINNDNSGNQSNTSKTTHVEYQFLTNLESINSTFTGGASMNLIRSNSELFSDTVVTSGNYALYGQIESNISDRLSLTLGIRAERNRLVGPKLVDGEVFENNISQETKSVLRAGLNYEVSDYTFLRASWGQGYRFPTITEKYIRTTFSGLSIFPNPLLRSEFGWSAEIGIKQGFRLFGFEGFVDVATFWSKYKDMTEFTFLQMGTSGGFLSINVGNTDIKGIEFNIGGQSELKGIPITLIAGYTHLNPKYEDFTPAIDSSSSEDYNILKYRTKHNWKIDIQAEFLENLSFGFSVNRTSHMEAIDAILENFAFIREYRNVNDNGYYKFDSRLAYEFDFVKLSLIANNLFNEEYTQRAGLLEAPRNFALRLDLFL